MDSPASGRVRLDAIRAQLRDLGYLRGPLSGLDGWMLAGRGGPSSLLRVNLIASLRVALIGGPLLGVPAAAAVAIANRPHVGAPRDLILLCVYLSAALGAALGLLEFLADLTLAWLARRGWVLVGNLERLAGRVGLLFFVATTLYLACVVRGGRSVLRGEGTIAWALWVAAVLGTLAAGHLIGRLARVGSLVALVAAGGGAALAGGLGLPLPRRRLVLGMGMAALLGAAGLVVFGPAGANGPPQAPPGSFDRHPLKGRIVFIGVDGLDAGWYDRAKARGLCPSLARVEAEGARYELRAEGPRVPPLVWTTIATGRPSSQHGILGYQAERVPGLSVPVQENPEPEGLDFSLALLLPPLRPARAPVGSGLRRARAVWEILSDAGVPAAAVNWWATWPAGPGDGTVVTERAFARLVAGRTPDRDASPAGLEQDLAGRFAADLDEVHRELAAATAPAASDDLIQTSAVIDRYHGLVARRLIESGLAQVVFVYLPGLDIARSRAAESAGGAGSPLAPVLSNVDRIVGRFLDLAGPEDLLIVVGDPGRGGAGQEPGLMLAWGARVVAGHRARTVTRLDLAPTVLALAGFPMARDLPGAPVLDFLKAGDVAARLPETIDSYGWRPEPLPGPAVDPFDREVLERLRSLGYIQ